jgi:hypothetical protein
MQGSGMEFVAGWRQGRAGRARAQQVEGAEPAPWQGLHAAAAAGPSLFTACLTPAYARSACCCCSKVVEHAGLPHLSPEERRRHLNFVVVGGGPTGVELAAELHDFVQEDVARLMPRLKVRPPAAGASTGPAGGCWACRRCCACWGRGVGAAGPGTRCWWQGCCCWQLQPPVASSSHTAWSAMPLTCVSLPAPLDLPLPLPLPGLPCAGRHLHQHPG